MTFFVVMFFVSSLPASRSLISAMDSYQDSRNLWACIGWNVYGILLVPGNYDDNGMKKELVVCKLNQLKTKFLDHSKSIDVVIRNVLKGNFVMFDKGVMQMKGVIAYTKFAVNMVIEFSGLHSNVLEHMFSTWLTTEASDRVKFIRECHLKALHVQTEAIDVKAVEKIEIKDYVANPNDFPCLPSKPKDVFVKPSSYCPPPRYQWVKIPDGFSNDVCKSVFWKHVKTGEVSYKPMESGFILCNKFGFPMYYNEKTHEFSLNW